MTMFLVISSAVLVALKNVLLKVGADSENWWPVALAVLLYNLSNIIFLVLLKNVPLGTTIVFLAMAQLVVGAVFGVVLFHETVPPMKVAGLALAVIATVMVMASPGS